MPRNPVRQDCLYCRNSFLTKTPAARFCSQTCWGAHNFWSKVQKTETCWIWTGCTDEDGYGVTTRRRNGQRLNKRCHCLVYEDLVGPVPEGLILDHTCRNRSCVNPDHLEPVSNPENLLRGSIARHTGYCKRGHALTPSNLRIRTYRKHISRECRACVRLTTALYRETHSLVKAMPRRTGAGQTEALDG